MLRRFNPSAQLIETAWGRVEPAKLLGTGLFDMAQAETHPDWLKEARIGEHNPETIGHGISSITFRTRRPFNMQRFDELKGAMEKRSHLLKTKHSEEEEKKNGDEEDSSQELLSEADHRAAQCVIRSKGLLWLGNRQSHWQQGTASLAGRRFAVSYGVPWSAAITGGSEPPQPAESETDIWQEPWGDRRTELVVIGQDMDHAEITVALEACVMTDNEMEEYTELFLKSQPLDILDEKAAGNEDLAERLKRFEIEILAPKRKKTQVLQAAPIATTPISAHSVIAVFQGGSSFRIEKYLKYAHLFPELASGLVKEFSLPIDAVDAQTSFLVDETSNDKTLSGILAYLNDGDKVELDWLQISTEIKTDVDEDRFSIIEQCLKLNPLDEVTEKALLQQYPVADIMIPKQEMATGSCSIDEQAVAQRRKERKDGKGKKGKKNRG